MSRYENDITQSKKGGTTMAEGRLPLFVGVDTIKSDFGISRAKAYEVIKELNAEMKAQNPRARIGDIVLA